MRWQKNKRARMQLANEAEQRIATAKLVDPDIEAKDEDIRLLRVRNRPISQGNPAYKSGVFGPLRLNSTL